MSEDTLFAQDDEDGGEPSSLSAEPWTVLVVDDDPEVLVMTSVLLRDFEFEGRPFAMVSALSGGQARGILVERPDIPVALLDVVMETEDAGLRLVRHIREDLGNRRIRIILRTGQPGQAPERDIVVAYDINDYKSKSELTAQKLFTTLVSALRAWRDLARLEGNRQGLERILNASARLSENRSMRALVDGLVDELSRVVDQRGGSVLGCRDAGLAAGGRRFAIVAGSGRFARWIGTMAEDALVREAPNGELRDAIAHAFDTRRSAFGERRCVLVFRTLEYGTTVFVMERSTPYTADDHQLLEIFCSRMAIGFDNVSLYENLVDMNLSLERRVAERTSELAAHQKELLAAKERVEVALARELDAKHLQRQFLATVTHEFRTPLAVIDSAAQMLALRAERIEPEMLQRLGVIRMSVQRLNALIDEYLTDERLQSGNLVLDRREVDIGALIRSVMEPFRVSCPGHVFRVETGELPSTINVDAHLIGLVFSNLINNAIKYAAVGTEIRVGGRAQGARVVFEVVDQGCGIPKGELPRVFDRFFRGGNSVGIDGTGIGLHTVQQIVQLHGGVVTIASTPGLGTTVTINLP